MFGAIIGDIIGSRFEWDNHKSKEFELFTDESHFTDDSVMTCAIAESLLNGEREQDQIANNMRKWYHKYPNAGYGGMFQWWCENECLFPYNSYGNGSAMRTSAVPYFSDTLKECKELARKCASITHDHEDGVKGAVAVSCVIWWALNGMQKYLIKEVVEQEFYSLNFDYQELVRDYKFDVTCQGSVPQALWCFFEGKDFEDCIRIAVSIGGDTDTICAMVGSMAEAYYGIPENIKFKALQYIPTDIFETIKNFYTKIGK